VTVNKSGTTVSATGGSFQVGTAWSSQVTVSPDSATGQVEILNGATSLGTATLSNGTASVSIAADALPVGTHTLTVGYAGDGTHAASSSTFSVTVTAAPPTSTSVSATCAPVTSGTAWSLTATVTPASATGTVEVRNGATLLGSATLSGGNASVSIAGNALPVGTHTLTVRYTGSTTHAASSTTCSVTVQAPPDPGGDSETSVSIGSLRFGTVGTARVTVTGTAPVTGTVEIWDGTRLLGSGQLAGGAQQREAAAAATATATIAIPATALSVGTHTLTVKYLGNATNDPSEARVRVEVAKAKASVRGVVKPTKVVVDRKSRIKVSVAAAGQVVTGKVRVSWRGASRVVTLRGGKAVVDLGRWGTTGRKTVRLHYLGSTKATADRATVTFTVRPKPRR